VELHEPLEGGTESRYVEAWCELLGDAIDPDRDDAVVQRVVTRLERLL
jgi:hypothetical protein